MSKESTERVPDPTLTLDPKNARVHDERSGQAVQESLRQLGAGRSIVVDRDGVIIGGNCTYEQAQSLGMKVRVVETNGDELVVVKRTDLAPDDPRRAALAVADNKTTDLSRFDDLKLKELLLGMPEELKGVTGFDQNELDRLFSDGEGSEFEEGDGGEFGGNEETEPLVMDGSLYSLGRHVLMCGDPGKVENAAILLAGLAGLKGKVGMAVTLLPDRELEHGRFIEVLGEVLKGPWYAFFQGGAELAFYGSLTPSVVVKRSMVWVWEGHVTKDVYGQSHMPFVFGVCNEGNDCLVGGDYGASVWTYPKTDDEVSVKLVQRLLRNHPATTVWNPWAGDGSVLMACEASKGRRCFAIEQDREKCEKIVRRWCVHVGKGPEEVLGGLKSS